MTQVHRSRTEPVFQGALLVNIRDHHMQLSVMPMANSRLFTIGIWYTATVQCRLSIVHCTNATMRLSVHKSQGKPSLFIIHVQCSCYLCVIICNRQPRFASIVVTAPVPVTHSSSVTHPHRVTVSARRPPPSDAGTLVTPARSAPPNHRSARGHVQADRASASGNFTKHTRPSTVAGDRSELPAGDWPDTFTFVLVCMYTYTYILLM